MIKKPKLLFLLLLLVVIFFHCQDKDQDNQPPMPVVLVEKLSEGALNEQGIDAIPDKDAIKIEWYSNKETNLSGYSVYRSKGNKKNFVEVARIREIFGLIDTTFIDDSVQVNNKYYYYIKAYNDADNYGEASDTVNYTLIPKAQLLGVSNVDVVPVFSWTYTDPSSAPHDFVFRIQRKIDQNRYEALDPSIGKINYSFPEEWSLSDLGNYGILTQGEYIWWIDAFFPNQNRGSESNIMHFQKN